MTTSPACGGLGGVVCTFEMKMPSSLGSRGLPFDPLPPPRMLSPSFWLGPFLRWTSCVSEEEAFEGEEKINGWTDLEGQTDRPVVLVAEVRVVPAVLCPHPER